VPASVSAIPETISPQQLRTFHISGRGIDQARPNGPLHPVEIDGIESMESAYPVYVSPGFTMEPFARPASGEAAEKEPIPIAGGKDGWLIPFTSSAFPLIYAAIAAGTRQAAKNQFIETLTKQCERLRELLRLDDSQSPKGASPEVVAAAMGSMGSDAGYFNAEVLASALHRKADGTRQMDAMRRERVEGILATLEHAVDETSREPIFWLFHSATAPASATVFGGRLRQCGDSFEDALEFCDQRLERFARYLRGLRAARLEVESAFDAAVHEEWLQRFDWQSADAEELAALPAFVVLEPAEWLARTSFASFGRLLRSGRPVQVLIPYQGLQADDLSGFMPDFGYLSIAHREAFVLQSSLSHLQHLTDGLTAMNRTLRPAVAVVSVPAAYRAGEDEAQAWLESSLLHLSRAFPLFRYDPDRGESWMERFELLYRPARGLTAAHAVAVSNAFRHHFRIIPDSDRDAEQVELAEYLARYRQIPPLAIPFLRVVDEHGEVRRAVVTRELVNLSRDRQKAYRILEELAGVGNAHVEAAVEKTREEVRTNVRLEGATEAIQRVITMLMNGDTLTAGVASAQLLQTAAVMTPETEAATADVSVSEEPYIDTFLCTSCNDCMKVNPLLFRYDGNKQASIADARAGTFAELVKAAEGCPARCIHTGMPRADDTTATAQVRVRATKFR
jgi:ferredoxin